MLNPPGLSGEPVELTNISGANAMVPERMILSGGNGQITGAFDTASSLMYSTYGSSVIPPAWLVALKYVRLGRISALEDLPASLHLIVPSSMGTSLAMQKQTPCFYELSFQKGS